MPLSESYEPCNGRSRNCGSPVDCGALQGRGGRAGRRAPPSGPGAAAVRLLGRGAGTAAHRRPGTDAHVCGLAVTDVLLLEQSSRSAVPHLWSMTDRRGEETEKTFMQIVSSQTLLRHAQAAAGRSVFCGSLHTSVTGVGQSRSGCTALIPRCVVYQGDIFWGAGPGLGLPGASGPGAGGWHRAGGHAGRPHLGGPAGAGAHLRRGPRRRRGGWGQPRPRGSPKCGPLCRNRLRGGPSIRLHPPLQPLRHLDGYSFW